MRVTNGKRVRKFVYDVRLGDRMLGAVCRGDETLWPDESSSVYSCVLDVAAAEGSVEWARWLHALDAVRGAAGPECYVKLTAGGREYMLGATFGDWPMAGYDGGSMVVFGENGPRADVLRPGDEVVAELVVPAREAESIAATSGATVEGGLWLPWLPGTMLRVSLKRSSAGFASNCHYTVSGLPSGTEHIAGSTSTVGSSVKEAAYDDFVSGDAGLNVKGEYRRGSGTLTVLWPGFTATLRFKVSAVMRHD